jgi:hypothetical protein
MWASTTLVVDLTPTCGRNARGSFLQPAKINLLPSHSLIACAFPRSRACPAPDSARFPTPAFLLRELHDCVDEPDSFASSSGTQIMLCRRSARARQAHQGASSERPPQDPVVPKSTHCCPFYHEGIIIDVSVFPSENVFVGVSKDLAKPAFAILSTCPPSLLVRFLWVAFLSATQP